MSQIPPVESSPPLDGEQLLLAAVCFAAFEKALDKAKRAVSVRSFSELTDATDSLLEVCENLSDLSLMVLSEASHDLRKVVQVFMTKLYSLAEENEVSEREEAWRDLELRIPKYDQLFQLITSTITEPEVCTEVKVAGYLVSWLDTFAERALGVSGVSSGEYYERKWSVECKPGVTRTFHTQVGVYAHALTNWPALARATVNLVGNAADHNPEGPLDIYLTLREEPDWLTLEVSDTGKGIDDTEKCFERGYTSNPGGGNSGLGLSIVKRTIEATGAQLELDGHGTHGGAQFIIRMPKVQPSRSDFVLVELGNRSLD